MVELAALAAGLPADEVSGPLGASIDRFDAGAPQAPPGGVTVGEVGLVKLVRGALGVAQAEQDDGAREPRIGLAVLLGDGGELLGEGVEIGLRGRRDGAVVLTRPLVMGGGAARGIGERRERGEHHGLVFPGRRRLGLHLLGPAATEHRLAHRRQALLGEHRIPAGLAVIELGDAQELHLGVHVAACAFEGARVVVPAAHPVARVVLDAGEEVHQQRVVREPRSENRRVEGDGRVQVRALGERLDGGVHLFAKARTRADVDDGPEAHRRHPPPTRAALEPSDALSRALLLARAGRPRHVRRARRRFFAALFVIDGRSVGHRGVALGVFPVAFDTREARRRGGHATAELARQLERQQALHLAPGHGHRALANEALQSLYLLQRRQGSHAGAGIGDGLHPVARLGGERRARGHQVDVAVDADGRVDVPVVLVGARQGEAQLEHRRQARVASHQLGELVARVSASHRDERTHPADPGEGGHLAVDAGAGELEGFARGVRFAVGEEDLAARQREAILDARIRRLDHAEREERLVIALGLHQLVNALKGTTRVRILHAEAELGAGKDDRRNVCRAHRQDGIDERLRADEGLVERAQRAIPGGGLVVGNRHRQSGQNS